MYLYENEIPYTRQLIVSEEGYFYGTYSDHRGYLFTMIDPTGTTRVNAAYLQHRNHIFTAPAEYWNGYFLDELSVHEFDFYQEALPANGNLMDEQLAKELQTLNDKFQDRSGRVYVLLKIK